MNFVVMAGQAKQASPARFFVLKAVAATALLVFAAGIPANAAAPAAAAQDISGVWWATTYSPKIQLVGGGDLPYTADGKAAYDKNIAALKSGQMTDAARRYCVPDGVPRILATPYPFEIIQTPGQTTLVYEMNHAIRVVAMDKPLPKDEELIPYPYYNGHSVGHWDGDTLVIESRGFNGKVWLDQLGKPSTEALHVTTRFHRKDFGHMDIQVTIDDPKAYTKPWGANVQVTLIPDTDLMEFICLENEKDTTRK